MRGRDRPLRRRLTLTCGQYADLSLLMGWDDEALRNFSCYPKASNRSTGPPKSSSAILSIDHRGRRVLYCAASHPRRVTAYIDVRGDSSSAALMK
jgi:hypothetical protein